MKFFRAVFTMLLLQVAVSMEGTSDTRHINRLTDGPQESAAEQDGGASRPQKQIQMAVASNGAVAAVEIGNSREDTNENVAIRKTQISAEALGESSFLPKRPQNGCNGRGLRIAGKQWELTVPDGVGPAPLAVFLNGFTTTCENIDGNYSKILSRLRTEGFATLVSLDTHSVAPSQATAWVYSGVVGLRNGSAKVSTENGSPFPAPASVDFSRVALVGHSMGGGASIHAAVDVSADLNVKVVVGLCPWMAKAGGPATTANLQTPTLLFTSTNDFTFPEDFNKKIKAGYRNIPNGVFKVLGELENYGHCLQSQGSQVAWEPYAAAFAACHVFGRSEQCDKVLYDMPQSLPLRSFNSSEAGAQPFGPSPAPRPKFWWR